MTLLTATITLILVMDPLGNVPVFLSLLKDVDNKRRPIVIIRESIIAFGILALFLFSGKYIMTGLGISESALGIAGGIILFLIAIRMIFPPAEHAREKPIGEPFIVPLAVPLIAGPSALAMILLFATQHPERMGQLFVAISLASLCSLLILLFANGLRKYLGEKGLIAIERLMGMILTTIAVQMFLTGIDHYFRLGQ
ncbi:MAG: hypothetical protein CMF50_08015 [Legionellales bacterium]|nr:hypothetical protein [Legionellales bacterium]|tara:strand:- start:5175 stop:5765 length:591 start_codon:yes stop_codon:yes gene_type:complete